MFALLSFTKHIHSEKHQKEARFWKDEIDKKNKVQTQHDENCNSDDQVSSAKTDTNSSQILSTTINSK